MSEQQLPKVVNIRDLGPAWSDDPSYVYVGRPSQWGNPLMPGAQANGDTLTREQVLALYELWAENKLNGEPRWLDPLRGAKALVCWCKPNSCHAETLVILLSERNEAQALGSDGAQDGDLHG